MTQLFVYIYMCVCVCVCVSGARAVYGVDKVADKLDLARKMGASQVINTGKVSCIILHFVYFLYH